jgi:hypothetical protein
MGIGAKSSGQSLINLFQKVMRYFVAITGN